VLIRKLPIPTACVLLIEIFFVTSATGKPNFTGTWVRDTVSSDAFTAVIVPLIGPGGTSPANNFLLRINHRSKHLQIAAEQDGTRPVVADYDLGRGWHSSMDPKIERGFGGTRYRSKWRGDILVLEKYTAFRGNFGTSGGNMEQRWDLSPGGDVLTITTTIDRFTTREVFSRK